MSLNSVSEVPENWDKLSSSEQLAAIFVNSNGNAKSLQTRLDTVSDQFEMLSQRIASLELENVTLKDQIAYLKNNFDYVSLNNEIVVGGIPNSCNVTAIDLAYRLFRHLNITHLCNDILDVRFVTPRIVQIPSLEYQLSRDQKSLIIRMKSAVVRSSILQKVRQIGEIDYSEIIQNGSSSKISMFEMLHKDIYELLLLTKSRAKLLSYKYTWVRNGKIFVRKAEGEERIQIISVNDLDRLQ